MITESTKLDAITGSEVLPDERDYEYTLSTVKATTSTSHKMIQDEAQDEIEQEPELNTEEEEIKEQRGFLLEQFYSGMD